MEQLTDQQLRDLAELIQKHVPESMGPGMDKFCAVWPNAREALAALQQILNFVPGVSALAGPSIAIIIAAGSATSNAKCKQGTVE
jgi:hypothetical protein